MEHSLGLFKTIVYCYDCFPSLQQRERVSLLKKKDRPCVNQSSSYYPPCFSRRRDHGGGGSCSYCIRFWCLYNFPKNLLFWLIFKSVSICFWLLPAKVECANLSNIFCLVYGYTEEWYLFFVLIVHKSHGGLFWHSHYFWKAILNWLHRTFWPVSVCSLFMFHWKCLSFRNASKYLFSLFEMVFLYSAEVTNTFTFWDWFARHDQPPGRMIEK